MNVCRYDWSSWLLAVTVLIAAMAGMPAGEVAPPASPAPEPTLVDQLKLETHGFASFGYLRTWGNNWLADDTTNGSSEFHEAALNVLARPVDRLRLGAQLFTRDLGRYDNGRVSLDWAYADYRAADWIGVQVGRVKYPLGLFNEELDVDAARTPIFLAPAVYALRTRDLFISTDGAKVYGLVGAGPLGRFEYSLFGGDTQYSNQGGLAGYLSDVGVGNRIDSISGKWIAGGMLHWHTPLRGLGLRVSLVDLHHFTVMGETSGVTLETTSDNYYFGVASAIYETGPLTFAAEYARARGRLDTHVGGVLVNSTVNNFEDAYVSATWHVRPRLDLYLAGEATVADANDRSGSHAYAVVLAAALTPIDHWSIKIEGRQVEGALGIQASDNPGGISKHWQVLALKTTVDF